MILNSRGTVEPPQYRWNTVFDNYTWTTDDNIILQDTTSTYSRPTEYQLLQECVSLLKEIVGLLKKKKKGRKK